MSSTNWPLHLSTWISNKFLQLNVSGVETLIPLYHTLCFQLTQLLKPPLFVFFPPAHSLASTRSSALCFPCSCHPLSSHYQPRHPTSSLVSSPLLYPHPPTPGSILHAATRAIFLRQITRSYFCPVQLENIQTSY